MTDTENQKILYDLIAYWYEELDEGQTDEPSALAGYLDKCGVKAPPDLHAISVPITFEEPPHAE